MVTTIEDRLTHLEHKNRGLTVAMLLMGVAATFVVTVGMARTENVPDVLRAHRFELVDENDNVRGVLQVTEDGSRFRLLDENCKVRAGLSVDKDGPRLDLLNESEKIRATLDVDTLGPALALRDENGKMRVILDVDKVGSCLDLRDEDGRPQALLSVDRKLGSHLLLAAGNAKMKALLSVKNDFGPGLALYDDSGTPRVGLVAARSGGASLTLADENGRFLEGLPSPGGQLPKVMPRTDYSPLPKRPLSGGSERPRPLAASPNVIESKIDGTFQGWHGETIVKLSNGQIWQQSAPHIEIHIAVMPEVLIYSVGGSYKMRVDGTDEAVEVRRLK